MKIFDFFTSTKLKTPNIIPAKQLSKINRFPKRHVIISSITIVWK